jgi:hypothetical protein
VTNLHSQRSCYKSRDPSSRQRTPGRKPTVKVGLLDDADNVTSTLAFDGRAAWALDQLIRTGERGCTPIDNAAPRWSHYVWLI